MKLKCIAAGAVACALSWAGTVQAANIVIGSGPDSAFYVLESPNIGTRSYEIRYTHDEAAPLDGWALLQIVDGAESELSVTATNWGSDEAPNWFVSALTWQGVTETSTSVEPYEPTWVQWVSGGQAGFPEAAPVASGEWTLGDGFSGPYRIIEPGAWEALKYGDFATQPSVLPVPEPSTALAGLAGLVLVLRRRRN